MARLRRRPGAIWTLCGFYLFLATAPIAEYLLFGPQPLEALPRLKIIAFVSLCIAAAVLLFHLHQSAVPVLAAIVFLSVIDRPIQFTRAGVESLGFLYALWLQKKNVLT